MSHILHKWSAWRYYDHLGPKAQRRKCLVCWAQQDRLVLPRWKRWLAKMGWDWKV
jgi:hypothetical protein